MYNEVEIKQGLQGQETTKPEKSAEDKLRTSASDQVITFLDGTKHVRRLGESVPVPFAGEMVNLMPGSYYFLGLLKAKISESTNRMSAIAIASKTVLNELDIYNQAVSAKEEKPKKRTKTKSEGAPKNEGAPESSEQEDEQKEILTKLAEKIGAIYKGMDDVRTLTREAKLEATQFIIYDTKVPNWYEVIAEGAPSAEIMDKQCPREKMLRVARREEIDNLLHVYKQIHEAVLPAESFFGLQGVI